MTQGRKSLYNDDINTLANAYIEDHLSYGDEVPIAAGMANELGVCKATLYNWANEFPEFLDTLSKLNDKQERLLASKGLTGDFNSTITKLMLANHGYHDKTDSTHSGPDGGPIETETTFVGVSPKD